jgi:hypothetical protein
MNSQSRTKDMVMLYNAIKEACIEIKKYPDDSIQDIFNEMFKKWETGLHMDSKFNIEVLL